MSSAVTNEVGEPPAELKSPKHWIIGDPLPTEHLEGQLLPKHLALPIFASDPLSSVAYAPQELLMILMVGGLAFLSFAPWVALAVIVLLVTVVASYRQLIRAYPSGGGDYEVAHRNLGEKAGLVVASALLVDYVMTVVVSVASGVDNIISAIPELNPFRVEIAVLFVIILAAVNLRGVSESSKAFAVPTYLFIGSVFVMVVVGLTRTVMGDPPVAESATYGVEPESLTQAGIILLLLRSFASGCSALTGVEAISNGVPAFRRPKVRNAQRTLVLMGGIAIILFAGLTAMALISQVHYAEVPCHLIGWAECDTEPQPSLMAQVAAATFGGSSIFFYVIQATTALVLLLAANTAFNGFPLLGSVLARDSYAPKSLSTRGDRLIYSNGVVILALAASVILVVFQANLTVLIQLYIIGVFVSFTLGQTGMVRHWLRELSLRRHPAGTAKRPPTRPDDDARPLSQGAILRALVINAVGAGMTAVVLLVVTITKFTHGAWIVFVMMPILFFLMMGVNRYYRDVEKEIEVDPTTTFGATGDHAIVLVGRMQKPTLKALDYAIAARHDSLEAVHVSIDEAATKKLKKDWVKQNIHVKLRILSSPYRDLSHPLIQYIKNRRQEHGSEVVTVYMPQYIVGHWWENLLHNHKARRIRQKLLLVHGVTVALVPWLLDSSDLIYGRRSRPLPGQDRRGEPVRAVPRRPITEPQGTGAGPKRGR
ncbi:amino acid/polyamine/organocation transporter (APC superfamily) [Agromyces ramosus]|uniref:Amino acid/polyamine/organocation transporter (APC superfamily) n=1 Tax=Agromyces ramosus TaxID=33879 RepID=A0A4Q7MDD0_9MICO|nr:amino acid/polyamine/organocation transporter (APC superfamily) [Agromyces ramosus]